MPEALFELRLLMISTIFASGISKDSREAAVFVANGGRVLLFSSGVHCKAKYLLKMLAFSWKSLTKLLSSMSGGMLEIFFC